LYVVENCSLDCKEFCNNEFWDKWYSLPKCKKIKGKWVRAPAHIELIQEYYKESYFDMK